MEFFLKTAMEWDLPWELRLSSGFLLYKFKEVMAREGDVDAAHCCL